MPVRLTPAPDAVISTKPVRLEDWHADGPLEEHIDILVFLRKEVLDAARKAGRRTITEPNGRSRDEYDDPPYFRSLFNAQVKGWRLLDPEGKEIPFTPENLAALPWDIQGWLHSEVLACGGGIPTRDLVISVGGGAQTLDYKSQDDRLVPEQADEIPDRERDAALRRPGARRRVS